MSRMVKFQLYATPVPQVVLSVDTRERSRWGVSGQSATSGLSDCQQGLELYWAGLEMILSINIEPGHPSSPSQLSAGPGRPRPQ